MIDKNRIGALSMVISSMEDAVANLEKAYRRKDIKDFEQAKKAILEFQAKLDEELK